MELYMGQTIQAQTLGPAYTAQPRASGVYYKISKSPSIFSSSRVAPPRLPTAAAAPSTAQEAGAARPPPLAQKAAAGRTTGALSPDIPLHLWFLLPHPKPELQGSAAMVRPRPFFAPPRI
jgi:hypothetical protein